MNTSESRMHGTFKTSKITAAFLGLLVLMWLSAVTSFSRRSPSHKAPIAAAITQLSSIQTALATYHADMGAYPLSLESLTTPPPYPTPWSGPYLTDVPFDPWHRQYFYAYPATMGSNAYDLVSSGPDKKLGTSDDLVYRANPSMEK